jgi:hypothetical protein
MNTYLRAPDVSWYQRAQEINQPLGEHASRPVVTIIEHLLETIDYLESELRTCCESVEKAKLREMSERARKLYRMYKESFLQNCSADTKGKLYSEWDRADTEAKHQAFHVLPAALDSLCMANELLLDYISWVMDDNRRTDIDRILDIQRRMKAYLRAAHLIDDNGLPTEAQR